MARKLTTNIFKIALLGGLALGVSGCESTRETFGLNKQSPDEFAVVSRAPLSLPPDFTLRVPEPGAPRRRPDQRPIRRVVFWLARTPMLSNATSPKVRAARGRLPFCRHLARNMPIPISAIRLIVKHRSSFPKAKA